MNRLGGSRKSGSLGPFGDYAERAFGLCAPGLICVRREPRTPLHATHGHASRDGRGSVRSHEAPTDHRRRTMSLKYNFSGIDGAASASTAELNYALKDLSIAAGPTDEAGSKGGNVEFEWKVEEGESSGDVFDFKAGEPTTAEETYYEIKMEDALISSWSSGAS